MLARIIEPTSKFDPFRVLEEASIAPVSYRPLKLRLPVYVAEASQKDWRR